MKCKMNPDAIPILRKAVEWAEAEALLPEIDREWDQSMYRAEPDYRAMALLARSGQVATICKTSYCIAGWIATQDNPDLTNAADIAERAAEILGIPLDDLIDYGENTALFSASNTIEDVRRIAENLAGERL